METPKLTGELVCDIYELTNKDGKNIQKLASKIEEGKGIARKFRNGIFKKSSYNTSTILLAKITYKYQNREETLSLLHYAISHKNNQAVKDLLEEAKKQKLLKEVLNEEMTTKHSDGREETHTILTDAISRRDNDIMRVVLKISEENGILKDILKKRIIIKHSDGEEMIYTPFTYAEECENSEAVEEILKFSRELGGVLNKRTTIEQQAPFLTVVTETATNASTTTAPCDEDSLSLNATTTTEHKDTASVIDSTRATDMPANACEIVTEVCSFDVEHKPVIDKATTDTGLCEDVNKSSEGLQPICENSEKVQQTSVKTDEQESNASNDLSPKPRFDDNATDKREKPLTTQAVIVGSVGAALLVCGIVACILKMYAIAVVGGIVGLACVSYALYNALKPGTKLEKVEDIERLDEKPLPSL
ncbi:WD_0033/WD_0034 family tandem repeat-containing protein [Wolbachia endosymbiont (group A) of Rhinocyllus conicus]|uniref:WD_0033/WD_0034 family tandem repeat-containing protein n=1 Tax=Wolbachia endosymbiont (group A) of Rhinocyllus conicus TaxID=2954053 RepID=UPI002227FA27|nr:hypothetical protein [Wolbachia endosymbiont (group A) of Rhinocyllus conicus]